MQQEINNDNSIFLYAITGVLLLISSLAFVVAHMTNLAIFELSYTIMAFVLFASSVPFLYKAIKNDKDRLRQV